MHKKGTLSQILINHVRLEQWLVTCGRLLTSSFDA